MPKDDRPLVIGASRIVLAFMIGWIALVCLLVITGALRQHDPRGFLLLLVWLPLLVPVALVARVRVKASGDTLTYHGLLRKRAWRRQEIARFAITKPVQSPRPGHLEVRTVSGESIIISIPGASRNADQQQSRLVMLENWRRARS
ncbi:MAG TPA: hypothetical protein VEL03_09340 [Streptosporangiaceae bacterium]|nr:hypothetical protein [Streptosporangiaceae bacterium]